MREARPATSGRAALPTNRLAASPARSGARTRSRIASNVRRRSGATPARTRASHAHAMPCQPCATPGAVPGADQVDTWDRSSGGLRMGPILLLVHSGIDGVRWASLAPRCARLGHPGCCICGLDLPAHTTPRQSVRMRRRERLVAVAGVYVLRGIAERLVRLAELAAQLEHGADPRRVERAVSFRRIGDPGEAGEVAADEADQRGLVAAGPRPPRRAHGAEVWPDVSREQGEAAVLDQQLVRRAQQRGIVLAGEQLAVAIGRTAGRHELDIGLGEPGAV